MTLRAWLETEYVKAQQAARDAAVANARSRRSGGRSAAAIFHASATARMCAFGEVLDRLNANADPRPRAEPRGFLSCGDERPHLAHAWGATDVLPPTWCHGIAGRRMQTEPGA